LFHACSWTQFGARTKPTFSEGHCGRPRRRICRKWEFCIETVQQRGDRNQIAQDFVLALYFSSTKIKSQGFTVIFCEGATAVWVSNSVPAPRGYSNVCSWLE